MKNILLVTLLSLTGLSAQAVTYNRTYHCDNDLVLKVADEPTKTTVWMSYPVDEVRNSAGKVVSYAHVVNVFSDVEDQLDEAGSKENGLPVGTNLYREFHYPNGDMYVPAEGDTNEEGFTLATSPDFPKAQQVEIHLIFWSDFNSGSDTKLTCQLQ